MDTHGSPHVRIWLGEVYVERAPSAWVVVCSVEEWKTIGESDKKFMLSQALKQGPDFSLPPVE